ncbi:hypothetical protein Tco_1150485 [Tanacetum coccineum]
MWRINWNTDTGELNRCLDVGIKEKGTSLDGSYEYDRIVNVCKLILTFKSQSALASASPKAKFLIAGGLFVITRRVVEVDPVLGVLGARCFELESFLTGRWLDLDLDLGFSSLVVVALVELDTGLSL